MFGIFPCMVCFSELWKPQWDWRFILTILPVLNEVETVLLPELFFFFFLFFKEQHILTKLILEIGLIENKCNGIAANTETIFIIFFSSCVSSLAEYEISSVQRSVVVFLYSSSWWAIYLQYEIDVDCRLGSHAYTAYEARMLKVVQNEVWHWVTEITTYLSGKDVTLMVACVSSKFQCTLLHQCYFPIYASHWRLMCSHTIAVGGFCTFWL